MRLPWIRAEQPQLDSSLAGSLEALAKARGPTFRVRPTSQSARPAERRGAWAVHGPAVTRRERKADRSDSGTRRLLEV